MARPRTTPVELPSGAHVEMQTPPDLEVDVAAVARIIAREEIASLCGLVLRRTQDRPGATMRVELASIFGEALADFSASEDEPGEPDAT